MMKCTLGAHQPCCTQVEDLAEISSEEETIMNATATQPPPPRPELFSKLGCFEADIASDDDLEELKSQICASLRRDCALAGCD